MHTREPVKAIFLLFNDIDATNCRGHIFPGTLGGYNGEKYTAVSNEEIITAIIPPGDYYIVAFYDYAGSQNDPDPPSYFENKNDYYAIYSTAGNQKAMNAGTQVSAPLWSAASISITFDETYKFQSQCGWHP